MNVVVLFDADLDQQEQLIELMNVESMSEWFDNLDLDFREDCGVDEEDIDDLYWDDVITGQCWPCFFSITDDNKWEYLYPYGPDFDCDEHNIRACGLTMEEFDYAPGFENFIYTAWQEAFERCGITDYAIICQVNDFNRCGDDGVFVINTKCSGSYEGKHFVGMATGGSCNIFNSDFDYEVLYATPREDLSLDDIDQGSTIMSEEYAKKFWCKITGEDLAKIEQLSLEDFVKVVNFYDYYAIADRIPEDILQDDIVEDDEDRFGSLLVCVASDTQYSGYDKEALEQMEQERREGKTFSIDSLLKK